ncbi:hypothetical protein F66182_5020 [Fusarium sp. NRRL 66182]|nr:hypothetical protein F66182_5020 [Fusarium sp. NRRL 66182]
MDHSVPWAPHHQHQLASFDGEKVDYGFESMLGHDTSLTHGLDSLGTCHNTENACLDQRCFDHYGKTSAAANTLDIGPDIKCDADKPSCRNDQANYARSAKPKARSRSITTSSPAKMTSDAATRALAHRQKRRRQSAQIQPHQYQQQLNHQLDYHQPYQENQVHSSHLLKHGQNLQHIEPMAALQTVSESLQHNFNMPVISNPHPSLGNFQQHYNHAFVMPNNLEHWPAAVAPSWATMLGPISTPTCMPMAWPPHIECNDAASAACTSACGETNCLSQCGDGNGAGCCYDQSCAPQPDYSSHASCCFEPTCADPEPCLDVSCQEAAIPCTSSHCVGTTVSTTPASLSVTTPSAEPEPMVNSIMSPVEPGRNLSLDLSSSIGHDFDFAHDLGHGFADGFSQHNGHLASHHPYSAMNQNAILAMPSHSPTPKTERADNQSLNGEADFSCRWVCDDGVLCSQKFAGNKELQDHCKNEHVKNLKKGQTGFNCTWYGCIKHGPFSQKSKLERHMQTHTGLCGIMLSAKQSLEQHMRTHSGEKPWECKYPGCEARFKQQSALTMHMRTHTGEKPLKCEICGKRFGESSNLSKHRRTHNVRGSHVCEHCGKDFHRLDQLRRHLQTHFPDGDRKSSRSS